MMLLNHCYFYFSVQRTEQTKKKKKRCAGILFLIVFPLPVSVRPLHVQPAEAEELYVSAREQVIAAQKSKESKANVAVLLLVCSPLKLPCISCLNWKSTKEKEKKKKKTKCLSTYI